MQISSICCQCFVKAVKAINSVLSGNVMGLILLSGSKAQVAEGESPAIVIGDSIVTPLWCCWKQVHENR